MGLLIFLNLTRNSFFYKTDIQFHANQIHCFSSLLSKLPKVQCSSLSACVSSLTIFNLISFGPNKLFENIGFGKLVITSFLSFIITITIISNYLTIVLINWSIVWYIKCVGFVCRDLYSQYQFNIIKPHRPT